MNSAAATEALQELSSLTTPCLVLDEQRMTRNITRVRARMQELGVELNPHLKTAKSIEVAQRLMESPQGPCTVSTLKEAEVFAAAGVRRITYAVGITPEKLPRVLEISASGVDLAVIIDSVEQANAVARACRESGRTIPVFIEVDTDGHRAGVAPKDTDRLAVIARTVHMGGAELRGVLSHAGESYNCKGVEALAAMAERERAGAVHAATVIRGAGYPCGVVSVGSTPTALSARHLQGVTEVRVGVFVFFDLVMAGLGVCSLDDIALSVLTTVIGHQRDRGWILVDAGWMGLSSDRGTSKQSVDCGYGLVCDITGRPYPDLIVTAANQEHGILAIRSGSDAKLPNLPVGARVRVLPNHACATAAQHDQYHVISGESLAVTDTWRRFRGW